MAPLLIGAVIGAALGLTGCDGGRAPDNPAGQVLPDPGATLNPPVVSERDRAFVEKLAASAEFAEAASRLAARRAMSPEVQRYAERMVTVHARTSATLARIARAAGIALPRGLPPAQVRELTELEAEEGIHFDLAYAHRIGIGRHRETLLALQQHAQLGAEPSVRAFAAQTWPQMRKCLEMAQALPGAELAALDVTRE